MSNMSQDQQSNNAFDPANTGAVSLVVQLRTYDVLFTILTHLNKDMARDLMSLHQQGIVVGSEPFVNGVFLGNEKLEDTTGPTEN